MCGTTTTRPKSPSRKELYVANEMPRRALRLVFEWLDLHRDELLENWERLSNSEAAKKIAPLE